MREQLDEIVAFAGLEEFIDLPVRTYSSGMYMRLGFAIASHIDADVLLLDEVFAVGDEQFQRKCFGKIFEFKQRGGTIVFVSHDASAVERLCDRAILLRDGSVEFDGPTHDAIVRYRQLLAGDRDPAERGAGLKEWGSGDARIEDVELLGAGGETRTQFLAGEPLTLRLRILRDEPLPRRGCRRGAGRVRSARRGDRPGRPASSAGTDGTTELAARFEVESCRSPTAASTLRLGLTDERGAPVPLARRRARPSSSTPAATTRGVVLLEGRWTGEEIGAQAERVDDVSSRTCPDWPKLMEYAPDLQFKHYTVAEAKLPGRGADERFPRSRRARSRSAATSSGTFSTLRTPTRRSLRRCG